MCNVCPLQLRDNISLFFKCKYATMIWRGISRCKGRDVLTVGNSIQQTWEKSWEKFRQGPATTRSDWAYLFMCTLWNIWKQRNDKVFSDKFKPPNYILVQQILQEAQLWMRYCTVSTIREGIG